MTSSSTTTTESEDMDIKDGLDFILSHFGGDNSLWPKYIGAGDRWKIEVGSKEHALEYFYYENLINCRIWPYPKFVEHYAKADVRDALLTGCKGIVPNFLFLEIDKGRFAGASNLDSYSYSSNYDALQALNAALHQTLNRINEVFHEVVKPTILWSGNGYHIYLPVQLSGPSWCLGHTDIFMKLHKFPDRELLRFADRYLTCGLGDTSHYDTVSFNNMSVRIPGSYNRKIVNGVPDIKPVKLLQRWDGKRPYINWMLRAFHDYLLDKRLNPPKKKRKYSNNNGNGKGNFRFSNNWSDMK